MEHGISDDSGRLVVAGQGGVNDEVVEQRVIKIGVKILLQIAPPPAIFAVNELQRGFFAQMLQFLDILDALLHRANQPKRNRETRSGGEDVGAATKKDYMPHLGRAQDRAESRAPRGQGGRRK